VYKKKKFEGQNALYYIAWYGFGRMFIEGLRTDALFIGNTGIRVSQLLGFLLFAVASALIVWGLIAAKKSSAPVAVAEGVAEEKVETEE
jgi:phosphatidylglycerol:prolipoprotein diacylglycerol transferase